MKKVILLVIIGFCIPLLAQRFVRTANTIAELVASNPNNVHTNVLVLGLTNVNDSQGGAFSWVVGATNTTNGFAVFASSTATNGLWIRRSYSSDTNYGGNSYITNLYVTNITANTIYVTNLYATNIYSTNIVGAVGTLTYGYTNYAAAGGNYLVTATLTNVTFAGGTITNAIILPSAGTYIVTATIGGLTSHNTGNQTSFQLYNATTAAAIADSYRSVGVTYSPGTGDGTVDQSYSLVLRSLVTVGSASSIVVQAIMSDGGDVNNQVNDQECSIDYLKVGN